MNAYAPPYYEQSGTATRMLLRLNFPTLTLKINVLCISFFFEVIFLNITFCQHNAKIIVAKFKVALQKEVSTEHPSNLTKLQQ